MAQARVTFCGHSTVIITTESGKRVMIDPFLEGNPSCPDSLKNPQDIDLIILTHGHSDHTSSAPDLALSTGARVYATWELAMLMGKEGVPQENIQPMNKGGTLEVPDGGGLKVTLTHALHSSSYDAKDGNTYYAGEACGVVLTLESGRTIYHAGDTSLFTDMELIGEEYEPTLALLPIGDRFTMNPLEAAGACELIQPEFVIPIHWGTFDLLTGTPEEFSTALKEQGEVQAVVLEPGGEFSF